MIAYCGLDCKICDAYKATQTNDDDLREKTAVLWSQMYGADIKADQINCDGCMADGVKFFHCNNCDIRDCNIGKGTENCAQCSEYICDTLQGFIKLAPQAGKALAALRK